MQQIRALVKSYPTMPGPVLTSIGCYMVFIGAFSMLWDNWIFKTLFPTNSNSLLVNLTVMASVILPFLVYYYVLNKLVARYASSYGSVKAQPSYYYRLGAEVIILMLAYFFIGERVDTYFHSPVSTTQLIFAVFLAVHWYLLGRGQIHYLVLSGLVIVVSFVPLFNTYVYQWIYRAKPLEWYGFNMVLCSGIFLIVAGLLDHWQMRRTLTRIHASIALSSEASA